MRKQDTKRSDEVKTRAEAHGGGCTNRFTVVLYFEKMFPRVFNRVMGRTAGILAPFA